MNIPESVQIGWRKYRIEQFDVRETRQDGTSYGTVNNNEALIRLYSQQSDGEKAVTLLHEIMHGIFYATGHTEWCDNEDLITLISEQLYFVIKENPEIFNEFAPVAPV